MNLFRKKSNVYKEKRNKEFKQQKIRRMSVEEKGGMNNRGKGGGK